MKNNFLSIILSGLLLSGVIVIFSACENFMVDAVSFKEQLKEEVLVAGAEEVEITIQAQTGTGTTSPNGLNTVKFGVPFNVLLQEDEDYGFIRWATYRTSDPATEVTGLVSFADPASASTKATLLSSSQDILIQPVCERRPYVTAHYPKDYFQDIVTNYPIRIEFNKDIDPDSVNFDSIEILGKQSMTGALPAPINTYFDAPSINGNIVIIAVNNTLPIKYEIYVTLDSTITDLNGLAMNDTYSWNYTLGEESDDSAPTIGFVKAGTGLTADSITLEETTHRTGNALENLYLSVDAADSSGLGNLTITETQKFNNLGEEEINTYPPNETPYLNTTPFLYDLNCPNDGMIDLDVFVTDTNGNDSIVKSITIIKDTTPPAGPVNAAKVSSVPVPGNIYGRNIDFVTTSDLIDYGVAAARSNIIEWAFSFDDADGTEDWTAFSDWEDYSGGSTIAIPASVDDGPVNIRVKFRDDQHNESTVESLTQINMDGTKPVITSAQIQNIQSNGGTDYVNSSNISLQIAGEDNPGSGVAYYIVDDDNSSDPAGNDSGWTTVGTAAPSVDFSGSYTATQATSHLYLWLKDVAGNISNAFDAGEVTLDSAGPHTITVTPSVAVNPIHVSSGTYYSKQDSIEFTPSATDDGIGIVLGYSDTAPNDTVNIIEGNSFTLAAESSKTLYAVDKLGNPSSEADKLSVSVVKDTTGPNLSSSLVTGKNGFNVVLSGTTKFYHDGELTFTATDAADVNPAGSGVAAYALSTESDSSNITIWKTYNGAGQTEPLPAITGSAKVLYLHLKDNLGNTRAIDIEAGKTWFSDTTGPAKPLLDTGNSGFDYYNSTNSTYYFNEDSGEVTVAFTSDDDTDPSGLYSDIAGFAVTSSGTPAATLTLTEGTYSNIFAVDRVGNHSTSAADSFIIDSDSEHPGTPAIIETVTANVFYGAGDDAGKIYYKDNGITEAMVEFTATESGGSGFYGFNDGTSYPASSNTSLTLTLGSHRIYAFDNAQNHSDIPLSLELIKDVTGPTGFTATNTGGYYDSGNRKYYTTDNSNPLVYFSATDTGSGIQGYSKNDDGTGIDSTRLNLTVTTDDQTVYALDNLNNATALIIDEVILDTADPIISKGTLAGNDTTITGLVTTDPTGGAGIDTTSYTSTAGTFNGTTISGLLKGITQTIIVTSSDRVGNVSNSYTITRTADPIPLTSSITGYIITGP
jgi:hypothetical protein